MAGKSSVARFHHLIQAMHAGRRLFADAANGRGNARVTGLVFRDRGVDGLENDAPLFRILVGVERGHLAGLLVLGALVHEQGRVAAVVDDQGRAAAVGPLERLLGAPPVFVERFTLPCEHRNALRVLHRALCFRAADHDGRCGVILRREDVARDPAHVGAEIGERFDEHRRLNRHVQAAHDARAGERFLAGVLLAQRHQSGHLLLGESQFLAAEVGERQVLYLVRLPAGGFRGSERMKSLGCSSHAVVVSFLNVLRC